VETSTLDIIGREDELAEIEGVLESVASAGSSVLVIEGEPGIGRRRSAPPRWPLRASVASRP
jgi:hypothetical protein